MQTRTLATLAAMLVLICAGIMPVRAAEPLSFRILQPTLEQPITDQFPMMVAFQSVDGTPIVRFDAYLDNTWIIGGRIKNPIPAGSFDVVCDLTKVSMKKFTPGSHTLVVKIYDSIGRVAQREQAVTLAGTNTERVPPTVRIIGPKDNTAVSGPTTVRIEASDDSGIKWVMFYVNGQLRAMMNEPPYLVPLDPTKDRLAPGSYTLRVRAIDAYDNESVSEPVILRVLRPEGRTPLERTQPVSTDPELLGVYEVSKWFEPFGGPVLPRQLFANVIAPLTDFLAARSAPLPALTIGTRQYAMPATESGALALLPPKSLPGVTAPAVSVDSRGLPLTPVLARAAFRVPPPSLSGRTTLPTPSLLLPAAPAGAVAPSGPAAVPFTAVLPPEKRQPALNERTIYAVPETPSPAAAAAPAAPLPQRPETSLLIALVPGAMMQLSGSTTTAEVVATPAPVAAPMRTPEAAAPLPAKQVPAAKPAQAAPAAVTTIPAAVPGLPSLPRPSASIPAAKPLPSAPTPAAGTARTAPTVREDPSRAATSLPAKGAPAASRPAAPAPVMVAAAPVTPPRAAAPARPALSSTPASAPPVSAVLEICEPYVTRDGDTLVKIARALETSPDELVKLNPGISPERPLPVSTALVVPRSSARIYLNDRPIADASPFIANGFTMVPFRSLVEAQDGLVVWLPNTREVHAWAQNTFMGVKIGEQTARINADTVKLPMAPSLLNDRTMVPLRYLMSALKLHVEFNAASGTYYLVNR